MYKRMSASSSAASFSLSELLRLEDFPPFCVVGDAAGGLSTAVYGAALRVTTALLKLRGAARGAPTKREAPRPGTEACLATPQAPANTCIPAAWAG